MSTATIEKTSVANRSLHGKVREQLRSQYLGESGVMLPPLRELSRQLGVNHATVTRALRDLEKEGVVEVVPRKGIFGIADAQKAVENSSEISVEQPSCAVELVLFSSEQQTVLDVAPPVMQGIERACREIAQKLQVQSTPHQTNTTATPPADFRVSRTILNVPPIPDSEMFVAGLQERGVGAVAFLGFGYLDFPEAHQECDFIFDVSQQIPTILIGSPHPYLPLDCVFSDPRPQIKSFLENCYAEGLRRFEYLGSRTCLPHQHIRYEEFCRFVMQHGLTWHGNQWDELSTLELAARLKEEPELPEVVVVANINRALTIILEAQRRGLKLPDEMRVLCFASVAEQAAPILPYATVALLDEAAVGERAAHLVLERWNREPAAKPDAHWERVPAQLMQP